MSDDALSDYFVDGPLLCTRWKNNGENTTENREPLSRRNHPSEEDVGDGNTEGDEQDGERGLDGIVHSYCYLALDAVHVDKGKQGPIHEHTGNHGDDAGDAEQLMGRVQLANERTADDADYCRTCKRTYYQALV